MSETSLSATLGNAFNKTGNAFALHDETNFESTLQQSVASIRSNPFNDTGSAFSEVNPIKGIYTSSPKKDTELRNVISTSSGNLNAIFSSFNAVSNKYETINSSTESSKQDVGNVKNPFSTKEKNAWNELNELDLSRLQMELNAAGNQPSIFSNTNNHPDQSATKIEPKKEIPVDLFKDFAQAAFSEFNGARYKNNEFINKISGFDCVRT